MNSSESESSKNERVLASPSLAPLPHPQVCLKIPTGSGGGMGCSCGCLVFWEINFWFVIFFPSQEISQVFYVPLLMQIVLPKKKLLTDKFLLSFCFLKVWAPWRNSAGDGKRWTETIRGEILHGREWGEGPLWAGDTHTTCLINGAFALALCSA